MGLKKSTPLVLLLVFESVFSYNSRTVIQTTPSGSVALVEFDKDGVTFGQCIYDNDGKEVQLKYKEVGYEVKAISEFGGLIDPQTEARNCKQKASIYYSMDDFDRPRFRSESVHHLPVKELQSRHNDFASRVQRSFDFLSFSVDISNFDIFSQIIEIGEVFTNKTLGSGPGITRLYLGKK